MTVPSFYVASDYAGISSKNLSAYYGYEKTDADGNWCFSATVNNAEIVFSSKELNLKDSFDPCEGLLAGIVKILDTHTIMPVAALNKPQETKT